MALQAEMYLILCPLVLLAGFIDAVAGGGGLISLPAYYLIGLPPSMAAGTNKLSASMGTVLAVWNYHRSGKIVYKTGIPAALGALICSALGVALMKSLPDQVVRIMVMCCIPLAAVFTLKGRGKHRQREHTLRQAWILSLTIGCVIGFYDGLVGPGTGTFLILLFVHVLGMDDVAASGTAKLVNLASNAAALFSLLLTGDVIVMLGIPAGLCAMLGAYVGSQMTIRRGGGVVRVVMLCVLTLLLLDMGAGLLY